MKFRRLIYWVVTIGLLLLLSSITAQAVSFNMQGDEEESGTVESSEAIEPTDTHEIEGEQDYGIFNLYCFE